MSSSTFVIMEAAGCHDGLLVRAMKLVDVASQVGADAVKFQWLSSPDRLAERRRAPDYLDAYRTLAFPREWFPLLEQACSERKIELMCTAYLPEDIHVVAPWVKRFKVSSFEAADRHFVVLHAEFRKPVFLSTGMLSWKAFDALARAYDVHYSRESIMSVQPTLSYLHCVSAYPCPVEHANLIALRRWDRGRLSGMSDHTRHPWTGALAVAAGARIVEFHARLDETDRGNADWEVSRTPAEAAEYVRNIRLAELMLGDGTKEPSVEAPMAQYRIDH